MRPPTTEDALLVVAAFSGHADALAWARRRLSEAFGPLGLVGEPFSFHHTAYYAPTMGSDLFKQLLVFDRLVPLDSLAKWKRAAIDLEAELAGRYPEARPLNLDPGLLTLGKFMLATTKDQAHRIYLGDGVFAEVTLRYCDGAWEPWPWTYADYREESVRRFLNEAREYYKRRLRDS
ncbi:MAG: DUF4416 family protein [Gemmataceae bacterium]